MENFGRSNQCSIITFNILSFLGKLLILFFDIVWENLATELKIDIFSFNINTPAPKFAIFEKPEN